MTTMSQITVTLDVRDDIRAGREPLGRIMDTASRLRFGERMCLIAPFKPVPLLHLMAQRGFSHEARPTDSGDWEVIFARSSEALGAPEKTPAISQSLREAAPLLEVDARGLEPPQPLVLILEALASLPEGAGLRARTDRRPLHLYTHLEDRGFAGETEEQADGSFITTIRPA